MVWGGGGGGVFSFSSSPLLSLCFEGVEGGIWVVFVYSYVGASLVICSMY